MASPAAEARERRVARRLETRGLKGLGHALVGLRGVEFGGRWRMGCLYAVGAEGAVFLVHDKTAGGRAAHVGKVALHAYHKPFQLSFEAVRSERARLREEAHRLEKAASSYMPLYEGLFEFANPLFDAKRGGEFAKPEPVFVMERLPGFDLDRWLLRVHKGRVPRPILRRNVDHVTVVVLRALWDLHERGFLYCDLRPGNVRIRGRSKHRVRLFDAGSFVPVVGNEGEFPHVPAYLPPDLFNRVQSEGPEVLVPNVATQAVMAGRTLYEVATARVPIPGEQIDPSLLRAEAVSPEVATVIESLCFGRYPSVLEALQHLVSLSKRAAWKLPEPDAKNSNGAPKPAAAPRPPAAKPRDLASVLAAARDNPRMTPPPIVPPVLARPAPAPRISPLSEPSAAPAPAPAPAASVPLPVPSRRPAPIPPDDEILPPSRPRPWWRRVLDALQRR